MVYMVGALRQLGAPLKGTFMQGAMNNMQQRVYRPPNVAGWEGGMSWLNTNTVLGPLGPDQPRPVPEVLDVLRDARSVPPADITTETAPQAYRPRVRRPSTARGSPAGTIASIKAYARRRAAATTAALRRQRIYTMQVLMLGGPDGQVM